MFMTSSLPANDWDTAIVESRTMRRIAMRSSTTKVPKTIPAYDLSFSPMSSKDLITTMVEDIDNNPPRKMLSIMLQFRACAVTKPIMNTPTNFRRAVTIALEPTFISFLKLNSRPSPNMRNMIPISDH